MRKGKGFHEETTFVLSSVAIWLENGSCSIFCREWLLEAPRGSLRYAPQKLVQKGLAVHRTFSDRDKRVVFSKRVCVCPPLDKGFSTNFGRGVQSTVETAPNEAIHLCWKQSLISSVYLLSTQ